MQEMTALLAQHGLALVFVNVLLTQGGAPVPSVPMLVLAGALIAEGALGFWPVLAAAVAATLIGNLPWYYAGRRYGYSVLRAVCRIAIEPDSCVKRTEDVFERWGALSLIAGKYIPGFATVAPPLAGALRVRLAPFVAYTAASALLWAVVPLLAGVVLQREVEWLLGRIEEMGAGVVAAAAAVAAAYVAVKLVERYLLIRFLRMVRITPAELMPLLRQGERPLILDVRSAAARRLDPRRIPGAIAVDLVAPEAHLGAMQPDRDVVVYCS
jgi:membrane protein DedA with SNARE-associated domain